MSRLTNVIEQVKENRQAWIYDEDGNIRDGIICGDVMEWLDELRDYEINVSDKFIEDFKRSLGTDNIYTYNINSCVTYIVFVF